MTRGQRRVHRIVWLVLAPALVLLLAYAVATRADPWSRAGATAPAGGGTR
ncbi:MAG: hypothetical protein R2708_05090 [Vicinamibacterales bacterium]